MLVPASRLQVGPERRRPRAAERIEQFAERSRVARVVQQRIDEIRAQAAYVGVRVLFPATERGGGDWGSDPPVLLPADALFPNVGNTPIPGNDHWTSVLPEVSSLPEPGNTMLRENILLRKAVGQLQDRLPSGWSADLVAQAPAEHGRGDAIVRLAAPDGRSADLVAEVKQRLDPRGAAEVAAQLDRLAGDCGRLAVSSWMSSATRERLTSAGINVIDLTGNIRVVLAEPGLFIEAMGADRDPWPEKRRVTLKGAKAARLVRALTQGQPPLGVRELAAEVGSSPGYVSKLLAMLDQEAAVMRSADGKVVSVDLARLLERWAEDAPLASRAFSTSWIAPRGLSSFLRRIQAVGSRYAVTSSLAAAKKAPVAAPRLATVYVDDPEAFAQSPGLRQPDAGANVVLLVPEDDVVFEGTWEDDGVRYAALAQVAGDLLSGPGRGPAEAGALIDWMTTNPEVWRG